MTRSIFSLEYRRLCQLLIEARKRLGLSQARVAARLGKPQSFVSKYERGERRLDVVELVDVAEALEIDPHSILAGVISFRAACGAGREHIWKRITIQDLARLVEQDAELQEIILSHVAEPETDET